MKIYVVTQGAYSGYGIITATLDRDVAEAIAKKYYSKWDPTEVEEYEDAELLLKPLWDVEFAEDGSAEVIRDEFDFGETDCRVRSWYGRLKVTVRADDEASAIKIASEKRAEYLAAREGVV